MFSFNAIDDDDYPTLINKKDEIIHTIIYEKTVDRIPPHRHLSQEFVELFKQSSLYQLYLAHRDKLLLCVRNEYINLYRHCDSIAKVSYTKRGRIKCEISNYYLKDTNKDFKNGQAVFTNEVDIKRSIIDRYEEIMAICDDKAKRTQEKVVQQALCLQNNANPKSNWYCIDIEWKKQFYSQDAREESGSKARFDIVAISKTAPHRVAIIELKYGQQAMGEIVALNHMLKTLNNS